MIRYRAAWVVPIAAPPLRDGWVVVDRGRVHAVGTGTVADGVEERDLGSAALMPGLVNAHTHLELSHLHGRIPPAQQFTDWIRSVVGMRRNDPDPRGPEILAAIDRAIADATRCGTAVVGDISNTLTTVGPLARAGLPGVVFYELIRFNAPDPEDFVARACREIDALPSSGEVRVGLAAHAPYSVSPLVFRAIRAAAERRPPVPCSVHLAESRAEVEFVGQGTGPWKTFLTEVGAWNPEWQPPGGTPVEYLDAIGFLGPSVLAVHGVQATADDLTRLRERGATLVACPRSNVATAAGVPPVARFYESGVKVAIGTDSLASTADLNVFSELAALRALAPEVPAGRLLESATRHGAAALGFDADYGTIEAGKSDRLLAVTLPAGIADVEEYLVGGIQPEQVRWVSQ